MEIVLNDIYELLKDHDFEVISSINVYLKCIICAKILNNARSSLCGCRYCFDCISTYLNGTQKACPGSDEDCKTTQICIDNLVIDHFANREISRLKVRCPWSNCDFEDELKNIAVHMKTCRLNLIRCPYFNFGCKDYDAANETVKNHLHEGIVSHTELLINFINNLTNENESFLSFHKENQTLITELQRKEKLNTEEIEELNEEMTSLKNLNRLLNEEFQNFKSDQFVENLKTKILEMETKSESQINQIKEINEKIQKIENNQTLITELQRKEKLNTEEIEELNEEMASLKNSNRSLKDEFQNFKSDQFVENLKTKILEMETKSESQINQIREINEKIQKIENNQNSIKNLASLENFNKIEIAKLSNEISAMKNFMKSLSDEFKNLQINKSFENIETKLTMFERKSEIQSSELTTIKQKLEQTDKIHKETNKNFNDIQNSNLTTVKKSNDQFELISKLIEEMKNDFQKKFIELEIHIQTKYIFGEFIWNVKEFSKIKTKAETEMNIFSDEFYSFRNGYKMCLSLNSNGFSEGWDEYFSIYLHLMKSENDDNLSWPCKLNFNIELLNQKNRENFNRKTLKFIDRPKHYGWNKPTIQRNIIGIGFTKFILLNDLLKNPLLYQDDQIFIKCSVEIQT